MIEATLSAFGDTYCPLDSSLFRTGPVDVRNGVSEEDPEGVSVLTGLQIRLARTSPERRELGLPANRTWIREEK